MKKALILILCLLLSAATLAELSESGPILSDSADDALLLPEDEDGFDLELEIDGLPTLPDGEELLPELTEDALIGTADDDAGNSSIELDLASDCLEIDLAEAIPFADNRPYNPDLLLEAEEQTCFIDAVQDSAALFDRYANGLLHGGGLRANATVYARDKLDGQGQVVYDALKPLIAAVAEGSRATTEFTVPVAALLGMTRATGQALTGAPLSNPMTDDERSRATAAWRALYTYVLDDVADALWFDCTYELYWLDRYENPIRAVKPAVLSRYDDALGDWELYVPDDACVTFRFPVLEQYRGEFYALDPARIDLAKQARANAKAIVEKYAGCSDYGKLAGYVTEICRLVDYDDDAATFAWQDANPQVQDPWKLIWVFDGDSGTNAVCEGYAQAFSYLCELTDFDGDISCRLVTGTAGGTDHSWNVVRMDDGKNYLVDVTWMDGDWDGTSGSLADWIAENRGRLFLCGGSGSVSGGYAIVNRSGGSEGRRRYRSDTLAVYPDAVLALAPGRFTPTGFTKLPGGTWYFDAAGAFATGKTVLDGYGYRFADNGALMGRLSGWHEIDGERRFFESDGRLHTKHTAVVDAAISPTCTDPGLTEGSHCAVCEAVLVAQASVKALGHSWGEAQYAWTEDCAAVTARRTCLNDPTHAQIETVRTAAEVATAPTCTARGTTVYTARFENEAFAQQQKRVENIPATGHRWGDVSYAWADDCAAVTARRTCLNDPAHVQTETARTTAMIAKAPTCTGKGITAYTARFENGAFAAQKKSVRNIPATGHRWGKARYAWADDFSGVTARRTCLNDHTHVQAEAVHTTASVSKAPTCIKKGVTLYTARFKNAAFAAQRKRVKDIPAAGHVPVTDPAVPPTVDAEGLTEGSHCAVCGKVLVARKTIPRLDKALHLRGSACRRVNVGEPLQIIPDVGQAKSYRSSNPNVASVNRKGRVIPLRPGKAVITVRLKGGGKLRLKLTVVDPHAPKSVRIAQGRSATLKVGQKLRLAAVLHPIGAKSALYWASNNSRVASVDKSGVILARQPGSATIIALTYNGKRAAIAVTVRN